METGDKSNETDNMHAIDSIFMHDNGLWTIESR